MDKISRHCVSKILIAALFLAQGRNLNQITILANMGKITVVYGDRLAEGYAQVSEQLRQLLREVT